MIYILQKILFLSIIIVLLFLRKYTKKIIDDLTLFNGSCIKNLCILISSFVKILD